MPAVEDEYLVAYDVACRKRWRQIFRLLHGYGTRVQLSVFQCRLDRHRHARMKAELEAVADKDEDRLLIARIHNSRERSPARRALIL